MNDNKVSHHQTLSDANDSVLVVIDVQQSFLDKLSPEQVSPLTNRIRWIVQMAGKMDIPLVVTAEDIPESGSTVSQVAEVFPVGTREHNKMSFGLAGDPAILSAVNATGRKTAVLVGLETDVCVMQSALGLLGHGYRVVVLSDASASPGPCHEQGLRRLENAGVVISTVKGTFYEWVRTLDFADEHLEAEIWTGERPEGINL